MGGLSLIRAGDWLRDHRGAMRTVQWMVIGVYALLVAVPAFLPLPAATAHLWRNLTLMAQFAFWGLWWPFVLVSMVLFGRVWCGIFCPEGALSEFASRHGRGKAIPRWMTWGGWPFVAFSSTTIYGQMISVYQYPKPALLILGGSTCAAIAVGFLYGRNKRVWCRYLCPVNGVFGLLSKLAPLHYRVDEVAWRESQHRHDRIGPIDCAPLVPIRTMRGSSPCHMCGRCSGFRGAVGLSWRHPDHEIVQVGRDGANRWDSLLILFGLLGVAAGAFQWPVSPWFVALKQTIAEGLVDTRILWPLEATLPWWGLTDYPVRGDVMSLLDGAVLLIYIPAAALVIGGGLTILAALAARSLGPWNWRRFHHLVQALIPLAGCGVFLGLSSLTVTLLRAEGARLPWVDAARLLLLAGASAWSLRLAWRIAGHYGERLRRSLAVAYMTAAVAFAASPWLLLFWVW